MILFGGKGGVGKTTISIAAALHFAQIAAGDPLHDRSRIEPRRHPLHGELRIESLDASALYRRFLDRNLESFLELGDRGTYLDNDELRRFFELSLPGVDELMAWMRIGELAEENPDATIVVDTAPTGHTLRMLSSADHFRQFAEALDSMQAKHRGMVRQFTRRDVRDAMDAFVDQFDARCETPPRSAHRSRARGVRAGDAVRAVGRRADGAADREIRADGIDVPFAILNRAVRRRRLRLARRDDAARKRLAPVVDAPRACVPLDTPSDRAVERWRLAGCRGAAARATARETPRPQALRSNSPASPSSPAKAASARPPPPHRSRCSSPRNIPTKTTPSSPSIPRTRCATSSRTKRRRQISPSRRSTRAPNGAASATRSAKRSSAPSARITPGGMTVAYDADAMKKLVEIAPPGADELFAITRLADLIADDSQSRDHRRHRADRTFPPPRSTSPHTAGEWVREFMRILLRYRELIPAGSLGEELIRASKALHALEEALRSDATRVIVVTRPERIVIAESKRLIAEIEQRGMRVGGVIANYVTPRERLRLRSIDARLRDGSAREPRPR